MIQIESIAEFDEMLSKKRIWKNIAVQGLDLRDRTDEILKTIFEDCIFLGCDMNPEADYYLLHSNNALFPKLDVSFNMYLNRLYSKEDLYKGFDFRNPETYKDTLDAKIYRYFMENGAGEPESIHVTLAQRLHDHSISDALQNLISEISSPLRVVAIMGGHNMLRGTDDYRKVAFIAKTLCEENFLMVSGGGPGAMEATHLGAWFAERPASDLAAAIDILSDAPSYKDKLWLAKAFEVIERFPRISKYDSLGIPTWLYGHEPPTPFASLIAKYFANSVREEGLLAIAKGGVIYAPGSAGTIQEIFQDATQNHYLSFKIASPMVFMNKQYWTAERPIYPLLEQMNNEGKYQNLLLSISDEAEEIMQAIRDFQYEIQNVKTL